MRYLLDECLTERTAAAMAAVSGGGADFAHLATGEVARPGAPDEEIPGICRAGSWDVLVTANVKDFGARKFLYEALLEHGVHVLVLRPGKQRLDEFFQLSLLSRHYRQYARLFADAAGPTLAIVTEGGVRQRSLAELVDELHGTGRPPVP